MKMMKVSFGIGLYVLLLLPPVASWMESIMIVHMLVQLPSLIAAGYVIGKVIIRLFPRFFVKWNGNGVPGILIAVFITTYWMLPRAMDEALTFWYIEGFKFMSLPLAGVFIADSWRKLTGIGRGFLFLNYLSMFGLMAWLYIDSPIQICNNYLEAEQKALGWGFAFITMCMVLYIVQYVFVDHSKET